MSHPHSVALVALIIATAVPSVALADSRSIAVLEYRAGVRSAPELATSMAREVAQLTPHTVIGPAEARVRLGTGLDARVAGCHGAPRCIAAIGRELGCDEVILVGVSQLGDLILAIQRIHAASGRVLARMAEPIDPSETFEATTLRSFLRRLLPASDFRRYGHIVVQTDSVGDAVFLDGQPRGTTPLPPLKVPAPGTYDVRVARPGFIDFVARLEIAPEAKMEVTPTLSRLTTAPSWYERWWVWALIGGVVAGGATAAIVGTLQEQPSTVPAVIHLP